MRYFQNETGLIFSTLQARKREGELDDGKSTLVSELTLKVSLGEAVGASYVETICSLYYEYPVKSFPSFVK